ncbi:DUF4149 domain-containing protein [Acidocella sp.]|uniref:DUF4149 domain-containing protein n=1 Tax=Acidocella sp. TaxID=50710 RepID=UPI003D08410F
MILHAARRFGGILSLAGLGLLAGGMLFFGAVMAPLVFTRLPLDVAGPFIRAAFPFLYGYCLLFAGLSCLGYLARRRLGAALVPGFTILGTLWSWFWLMPRLDAWRLADNSAAFARGHDISTWVFGAEFFLVLLLLIREGTKQP